MARPPRGGPSGPRGRKTGSASRPSTGRSNNVRRRSGSPSEGTSKGTAQKTEGAKPKRAKSTLRKVAPSLAKSSAPMRRRTKATQPHEENEAPSGKRAVAGRQRQQTAKAAGQPEPKRTRPSKPRRTAPPRRTLTGSSVSTTPILEPMRIAKAMAKAGLCSRRDAEAWIADGRVELNGRKLTTPAVVVSPGDRILVDGAPLPAHAPPELWRYHKPRGRVTTHKDPEGRPTVFEAMPEDMPRVISIGRLDFNTEGLLLLTTDGDLARHLELPATGWLRRYRVRAHGDVAPETLTKLADGVTVDGVAYGAIEAKIDSKQGGNVWLSVALREGKNREVRNVMASLGLAVNRLIRVSYGPFQLQALAIGQVEHVKRRILADQLGPALAEKFGLREAKSAQTRQPHHRRGNQRTTPPKET